MSRQRLALHHNDLKTVRELNGGTHETFAFLPDHKYFFNRLALYDWLPRCQVLGLVPESSRVLHQ